MGKLTKIAWCHHTFNGWWGCEKVSAACRSCYADTWARRTGFELWGKDAPRRFFGDKHWNEPLAWDRAAADAGERRRVFCSSMSDVFEDRRDLDGPRHRIWGLIDATQNLDWLLLTKRPENVERLAPSDWVAGFRRARNVWLGVTLEDNKERWRLEHLLAARWAAVRFLSMEPLLEDVEIASSLFGPERIGWVITGYESGGKRRPTEEDWIRRRRDQCQETGTPFLYKQKVIGGNVKIELPCLDDRQWNEYPSPRLAA